MRTNRSVPPGTIIPVLGYRELAPAVDWLCRVFGFRERLRIGDHRSQLALGDASIVATASSVTAPAGGFATHSLLVRVADVDAHHARARAQGARILAAPESFPYGERQYSVIDVGGHRWTFSETVADADPASWGGEWRAPT